MYLIDVDDSKHEKIIVVLVHKNLTKNSITNLPFLGGTFP